MATNFTPIDLSQLPAPIIVESLSFDTIFSAMLADLQERDAVFDALIPSDPAYKIIEVCAYRELLIRQRVNDATKGVMLAYATGPNLDQIAGNYNVTRLVITPANPEATPPTDAVMETDSDLRNRVLLAFDSLSVAGPERAYIYHSLSAHSGIKDVSVTSPDPGEVAVSLLSKTGDGTANSTLINAVIAKLDDNVRPLTDSVTVESATIVEYEVTATLKIFAGPDSAVILAAAQASIEAYANDNHRLGRDITLSGIYAALHVAGVQKVTLTEPNADIVIESNEAAYCTDTDITISGIGE